MRKTVIVILSIVFTGALLLYTAQANLDLLSQVSPNPQFVGFAMIALEGGVIYWIAYYLLHWNGIHKGIAICMIFVDFLFSVTGFFVDTNEVASKHNMGTSLADWFPRVILFVAADIVVNVGVGIIIHLLPDNRLNALPSKTKSSSPSTSVQEIPQGGDEQTFTRAQLDEGLSKAYDEGYKHAHDNGSHAKK